MSRKSPAARPATKQAPAARRRVGRPALAPGESRSELIRVRATPADMAGAKAIAKQEDTSVSDFGLAAIRLAIARGSTVRE